MHIYNWHHSNATGIHYVHEYRLQYTWRIPLAFDSPLLPLLTPLYLLGTLLAVTGSVHLGLRLLVNWPSLSQPFPQSLPPPNSPEPRLLSAPLWRPHESGIFCPEQWDSSAVCTVHHCDPFPVAGFSTQSVQVQCEWVGGGGANYKLAWLPRTRSAFHSLTSFFLLVVPCVQLGALILETDNSM